MEHPPDDERIASHAIGSAMFGICVALIAGANPCADLRHGRESV